MSASDPTAIVPLRGYKPNSFAGFVHSSSTIRLSVIRPPRTPNSWIMCSRFSSPGPPFGIFEKSWRPSVFCPSQLNAQWSVEIADSTSVRTAFQSTSWFSFRRAGDVRELDRAVRRLALRLGRPCQRVPDRIRVPLGERVLDEHVDGVAILRMHHHERPGLRRDLHRLEERLV